VFSNLSLKTVTTPRNFGRIQILHFNPGVLDSPQWVSQYYL
jgi:hypothetical protein